jgi:pSer/pThr/pTyr-binding forkhead associated (FHA) protein
MNRFPQLHMIDTGFSTRSVDVTGAMTIGRDTANDIVLAEITISRCHALLLLDAGHVAVVDLESANGTFVNGIQVWPDAPVHLADGDMIRMGRVIAHYSAPHEEA